MEDKCNMNSYGLTHGIRKMQWMIRTECTNQYISIYYLKYWLFTNICTTVNWLLKGLGSSDIYWTCKEKWLKLSFKYIHLFHKIDTCW